MAIEQEFIEDGIVVRGNMFGNCSIKKLFIVQDKMIFVRVFIKKLI